MESDSMGLKVTDLTKIYPHPKNPKIKIPILSGVNFELKSIELAFLVGSSGSGKSTLLNILSGELTFDAGEVILNGKSLHISNLLEKKQYMQNVRKVIQIPRLNLDFNLSLRDNLRLPLILKSGFTREAQKNLINKCIKKLGLQNQINTSLNKLSGGELQRLAIGVSTIIPPKILLLDEPTSQLDSNNSQKVLDLILEIINNCETIALFATHNESLISNGRILRLVEGRIFEAN